MISRPPIYSNCSGQRLDRVCNALDFPSPGCPCEQSDCCWLVPSLNDDAPLIAASRCPDPSITRPTRGACALRAFRRRCSFGIASRARRRAITLLVRAAVGDADPLAWPSPPSITSKRKARRSAPPRQGIKTTIPPAGNPRIPEREHGGDPSPCCGDRAGGGVDPVARPRRPSPDNSKKESAAPWPPARP